jgi:hypothetical protein
MTQWSREFRIFAVPKFTNIYPKRGISVNLPLLCEVGLPGTKAGLGFNTFKEPAAPQMRAQRTESQNKSYIASDTYLGVIAIVTVALAEFHNLHDLKG